ncbi:FkbM family methyltransferase [Phaeobacter gallaeciensis]|uniref:FkbM family methyltransferase n=1 Tax=Phaeobacter gallaeciensis TaxID=60890 RepID=A0ABD4XEU5_9RHOB|nr:FkbM family methyltransferase [Phaeobacter gallaeciensis]MDE4146507.1 FkbM family methyltransferase [Phaeobacter gallaeciensis]MDE4159129.1 FkbM family methyltransferase [Phaeobacter gallaeciensis]MDE4163306.1 FkbM family methyltransferase [Phaeobacter gallaeciensis]MDE4167587.1 FkbM family methyltransferase [Phaeobacter gallaeciensis]MDE4171821.1 FkbM family methyltransferase [Phaeobacter gallaeciensis]
MTDTAPLRASLFETPFGVFWAEEEDHITKQLAEFGAHTRNELSMLLTVIRLGDRIVDIGAHIGTYAIPMAAKAGPEGRVLAIEGSARTFQLLQRNIGANGLVHRVAYQNKVLGQRDGPRLRRAASPGNSGAGHYLPDMNGVEAEDPLSCLALNGFAQPDVIKIDVEGMECAVLTSLQPLLNRQRPILYIEVVAQQLARLGTTVSNLEALLAPYGYSYFRNVGARNSESDSFIPERLNRLEEGGEFFDLLALPDARVPLLVGSES